MGSYKKWKKLVAGGLALATLSAGAVAAFAEGGGTGEQPGGGGGGKAKAHPAWLIDDNNHPATVDGVKWFIQQMGGKYALKIKDPTTKVETALNIALQRCRDTGGGNCRLVGVGAALTGDEKWYAVDNAVNDVQAYKDLLNNYANKILTKPDGTQYRATDVFSTGRSVISAGMDSINATGANSNINLIVLGDNEPESKYNLSITTNQQSPAGMQSGGNQGIHDVIHATNDSMSHIQENLNALVYLNWDGFGTTKTSKVASKQVTITSYGDTQSPNFTPADFGWKKWAAGRYWFDIAVPTQGKMKNSVNTNDREPLETVEVSPAIVRKHISNDKGGEVSNDQSIVANSLNTSHITQESSGSDDVWIRDTIQVNQEQNGKGIKAYGKTADNKDTKIFVGALGQDDFSKITVTDEDGKTYPAEITVDTQDANHRIVSAHVKGIGTDSKTLTMHVPVSMVRTRTAFTAGDTGSSSFDNWGNSTSTEEHSNKKDTTTPDKVWLLDKDGNVSLESEDPNWTNKVDADTKTFNHKDPIGASVQGHFLKKVTNNLNQYSLTDDWTDAAKYVNFTEADKSARVYVQIDGQWVDETQWFTIKNVGTKTVAEAKPEALAEGGIFANGTRNLSEDVPTKLVIRGIFYDIEEKPDVDTHGATIKLTNAGAETWNGEDQPTNVPPVFIWNPKPTKDVLGDSKTDGTKTDESIDGQKVFPGQTLKYSVGIDTNAPNTGDRGYKLTKFGAEDFYDADFQPDFSTLQVVDNRHGAKVIAKKYYTVTRDDANNSFKLEFTQDWIDANMNLMSHNDQGSTDTDWLTMTFSGIVKESALKDGSVDNVAYELVNKSRTKTNKVHNEIPPYTPHKEDLNAKGDNIDTKYVSKKTDIVYRLTLDASYKTSELAYTVHKLGMVDDYDEDYLNVNTKGIRVTNVETGEDVTSKFNIQDKDGKVAIFAKTVDHTNSDGELIKGDPQPEDLFAYDQQSINMMKSPAIDQSLMGNRYYITLPAKVKKITADYVIKNQAYQNFENKAQATEVVSNPLQTINPNKDVVAKVGGESINKNTVEYHGLFDYKLTSSKIHGNRADDTESWSIRDKFNAKKDSFTGQWVVLAEKDIKDANGKVLYKKGDTLAQSVANKNASTKASDTVGIATAENVKADGTEPLFEGTWENGVFTVKATDAFLKLANADKADDLQWSVYTKMERIGVGTVFNQFDEHYNDEDVKSNVVVTRTPEDPKITLEKYDDESGIKDGDRDEESQAKAVKKVGDKINFQITNNGNMDLTDVKLSDATIKGSGKVENITFPQGWDGNLAVGKSVTAQGILTSLDYGDTHGDEATVTGKTVEPICPVDMSKMDLSKVTLGEDGTPTGGISKECQTKTVTAKDKWYGKTPKATLELEKWDAKSGKLVGDRDNKSDALTTKGTTEIKFTIKNTGEVKMNNINLTDKTIDGVGTVKDIKFPDNFKGSLNPGEEVEATGTLEALAAGKTHTDRATVTGIPEGFDKKVTVTDDWNGKGAKRLAQTGADVAAIVLGAALLAAAGGVFMVMKRKVGK